MMADTTVCIRLGVSKIYTRVVPSMFNHAKKNSAALSHLLSMFFFSSTVFQHVYKSLGLKSSP